MNVPSNRQCVELLCYLYYFLKKQAKNIQEYCDLKTETYAHQDPNNYAKFEFQQNREMFPRFAESAANSTCEILRNAVMAGTKAVTECLVTMTTRDGSRSEGSAAGTTVQEGGLMRHGLCLQETFARLFDQQ